MTRIVSDITDKQVEWHLNELYKRIDLLTQSILPYSIYLSNNKTYNLTGDNLWCIYNLNGDLKFIKSTAGKKVIIDSDVMINNLTANNVVYSLNSLVGNLTLQGTTNQINVSSSVNTITLSTPQNIHTGASPVFSGLTLSSLTPGSILFAGSGSLISQDNTNLFWDNTNKRLGIGTTTPSAKLEIDGAGTGPVVRIKNTGSYPSLQFLPPIDTSDVRIWFTRPSDLSNRGSIWYNFASDYMSFRSSGVENTLMLSYGNVGIGMTNPRYKLDVNGPCHATSFPTSSDERFKTDIKPINDALNIVMNLRGVRFKWNDFYKNTLGVDCNAEKYEFGVIAQETEKVAPEVITKFKRQYKEKTKDGEEVDKEEEFLSVDYGRLVAVLVEAIKEQQKQIEELKKWIKIKS